MVLYALEAIDMALKKLATKIVEKDLQSTALPERFWHVAYEKTPESWALRGRFSKYLGNIKQNFDDGVGLYIYGAARAGKTSAAAIVLMSVVAHGGSAYFIRPRDLMRKEIDSEAFIGEAGSIPFRRRALEVDLLVLDAVEADKTKTGFLSQLLEEIIRARYDKMKTTIITSRCGPKEIETVLGSAAFTLMGECMIPLLMEGGDWHNEQLENIKTRL